MKLQTKISLTPKEHQIDYHSKIVLLGSCFVENMGGKLDYFKFQTLLNPFGIIFHPVAIEKLIIRAVNKELYTNNDLFYYNEQWHCFEVHSSISASEKEDLLELLNSKLLEFRAYLLSASHILLTFGTAWVYRFIKSDTIVANCNKIPQKEFSKELLSIEEIKASIKNAISVIKSVNPSVTIINTVSPVRHLKDGFVENTRSKAHLISAIYEVSTGNESLSGAVCRACRSIEIFPSYEIMMDELRDYRFYTEDMLHPNKTAISIIWEAFSKVWIATETKETQKEVAVIQTGLLHRPFNPETKAHHKFLVDLNTKIERLQKRIPRIKF